MARVISPFPTRTQWESNEQTNASFTKEKIMRLRSVTLGLLSQSPVETNHLLCTRHHTDCWTVRQESACRPNGSHMMHFLVRHLSNHIRDSLSPRGTGSRPNSFHDLIHVRHQTLESAVHLLLFGSIGLDGSHWSVRIAVIMLPRVDCVVQIGLNQSTAWVLTVIR